MLLVLLSLLLAAAALGAIGWLALAGLRDGDHPGDVTVTVAPAVGLTGGRPAARVCLVNPGASTALISLRAARPRAPHWLTDGGGRGGSRRRLARELARGGLSHGQIIALAGAEETVAEVALPSGAPRARIVALVGTEGRLRRHRLELEVPPGLLMEPRRSGLARPTGHPRAYC